jgi:Periplasmic binding protein domain/Galactokinase galactose-binding signature
VSADAAAVQQAFARFSRPSRVYRAPGRVNLIGEFTDYNDGFVMPAAIGFHNWIAAAPPSDRKLVVRSRTSTRRSSSTWTPPTRGQAITGAATSSACRRPRKRRAPAVGSRSPRARLCADRSRAQLLRGARGGRRPAVPVVCVNTGAPEIGPLTTVSVDSMTNGSLVAELLGRFTGGHGKVVVVTGQLATTDHAMKLEGFRTTLAAQWPRLELAEVIEAHDDAREAYQKFRKVITRNGGLVGVYVATANSMSVMRAIADAERDAPLTVIATDLFPALVPLIESGAVAATVHQRPRLQGQLAFRALCRFLIEGVSPPPLIRLAPHVVVRSNLMTSLEEDRALPQAALGTGMSW